MRSGSALTVCLLIALAGSTAVQSAPKVVQQIALVRHGIRSPTKPPEDLNRYSRDAWPQWPVEPGLLTGHGQELMHALGAWHRSDFRASGLDTSSCGSVRVIADTDTRNHQSAAAFLQGVLDPGCEPRYYAYPAGRHDPLFAGVGKGEDTKAGAGVDDWQLPHPELAELQRVLLGCDDAACLAQAEKAGKNPMLTLPPAEQIDIAGSLAENLMLEYAQGFPADQTGWGRADAAAIERLITVHNAEFALTRQPHALAEKRDGNMVAHIAATFARTAGVQTRLPSLAANGERAIVLIGHDTDLTTSASLLGVQWHDAAAPDDYPPGGALIYQLVRTGTGRYAVRLRVAMPTLRGLRGSIDAPGGLRVATLRQPACGNVELCPLPKFLRHVRAVVADPAIDPASGNEPAVTP